MSELDSAALAERIAEIASDRKAADIRVIDLGTLECRRSR